MCVCVYREKRRRLLLLFLKKYLFMRLSQVLVLAYSIFLVARELLALCGIQFHDQGLSPGLLVGSTESQPLDYWGRPERGFFLGTWPTAEARLVQSMQGRPAGWRFGRATTGRIPSCLGRSFLVRPSTYCMSLPHYGKKAALLKVYQFSVNLIFKNTFTEHLECLSKQLGS